MARVLDEYDQRWNVEAGDPAARVVRECAKLGYKIVILPSEVLTGRETCATMLAQAAQDTGTQLPPPEAQVDALPDFVRHVRMLDCLEVGAENE